jgi:hypothetical protein
MTSRKEIIISAEKAVFWLDKNGYWHNRHGAFEHKKIIAHFHASIRKDERGYHLCQSTDTYVEKVYFRYEDTALFVFHVIVDSPVTLVLNTGERFILNPRDLFIENDHLYLEHNGERIKFTERSLMKLSSLMDFDQDRYHIRINDESIPIPVRLCGI